MPAMLAALHRFLLRHAFYALLLASALAAGSLGGRALLSGSRGYSFMLWNLALAWVPYLCSLAIVALARFPPGRLAAVPLGLLWLIFFPNAPYLVTDLVHLQTNSGFRWWYDVGMLAAFAWAGLMLAAISLHVLQAAVREWFGALASWAFVVGSAGLSGLGVYLGRFLRWNSWDLLLQPQFVMRDLLGMLMDPARAPRVIGVTALFAALVLVCYLTLRGAARALARFVLIEPVYALRSTVTSGGELGHDAGRRGPAQRDTGG